MLLTKWTTSLGFSLMSTDSSLTERLQSFMAGDSDVTESLLREVLPKLHEIAARELKKERYFAPLSKTELIHEVWLRNLSRGGWTVRDRGHFYALASLAMRRILVDLARKRLAQRRGGYDAAISLAEAGDDGGTIQREAQQIVEIGIAMERLEVDDPDAARMVDMIYIAGFTLEETAQETGLTFRQVRSRWERGRDKLKKLLRGKVQGQTSAGGGSAGGGGSVFPPLTA
jgi:RNA polymerase sigma factor (TIGR02999 family)